jgi:hypothetical protein
MKEINLARLIRQFSHSPAKIAWIEAYLSDQGTLMALLDAVDDSPYSLSQWIDAFIVVGQWMEVRGLRASFGDQLGYVHCACESAGTGANLTTLSAVVSEMLDDYGFGFSQPKDES